MQNLLKAVSLFICPPECTDEVINIFLQEVHNRPQGISIGGGFKVQRSPEEILCCVAHEELSCCCSITPYSEQHSRDTILCMEQAVLY